MTQEMRSARPVSSRSALLVTVVALLVYANTLPGDFTFDDPYIARDDPFLTDGRLADAFGRAYWPRTTRIEADGREAVVPLQDASREGMTYRPLATLSYALNRRWFGAGALSFHLVNLLAHAAACVLVLALARRVLRTETAALGAALLFAVHPVHVEAVAGIVGRSELLAAAAWVGALVWVGSGSGRRGLAASAVVVFALALAGALAKETAATLPLALVVLLRFQGRLRTRFGAAMASAAALAWVPLLALRTAGLGTAFPGVMQGAAWAGNAGRWSGVLGAATHYARTFLFPRTLLPEVPVERVLPEAWSDPRAWAGAALGALGLMAAVRALRGKPGPLSLGILLAVVAYLPVSHLAFPVNVIAADRLFYLPSVGVVLAVGALLETARSSSTRLWRRAATGMFAVALVLLAGRTVTRNVAWSSDTSLFEQLVEDVPESARAWARLGQLRREAGRDEEARQCWERALELDETESAALHGLGWLAAERGTDEGSAEALEWFRRLAEANPRDPLPLHDAAWVHLRAGNPDRAIQAFRAALELDPAHAASAQGLAEAYLAKAVALARAGGLPDAERALQAGIAAAASTGADATRLREMLSEVRTQSPSR